MAIMRSIFLSFFMRSKFLIMIPSPDCSIFHEIKIQKSIIRQFWSHDQFVSYKCDHEIEIQKSIIRNFDLMIVLLVASTIMRSKFKINYLNLVSCTCGQIFSLIISHLCIKTFDFMIVLAANKLIMGLKFPNNAFFKFQSHDWFVSHKNNHEIEIRNNAFLGFNLMIKVSTSWSILLDRFNLMNKHNFDLMIVILIPWKITISISWNSTSWPPLS